MQKLNKEEIAISRFISKILRHSPETIGIELQENGWVNTELLIKKINESKTNINIDMNILEKVVLLNDKKRFSFNDEHTLIRANQGHSINIDIEFKEIIPPEFLFHGTSISSIDSIEKEGIKKMKRHHVHLSLTEDTAKKVGSRHGKPVIIKISAKNMHDEGIKFYLSDNGVYLCEFVHHKYIIDIIK